MSARETANTHAFCRDSVTSQGAADSTEATVAPRPRRTRSEGSAQHNEGAHRGEEGQVAEQRVLLGWRRPRAFISGSGR